MKHIDRLLIKIIIFQFIVLICVQVLVREWSPMTMLQKVTYYEGVNTMEHGDIIETINGVKGR
ncbi:DUF5359 family protein [Bacillus sp. 2205SS5-2]|uniref:DUF5359 family protein n=1 Tax=Bacillus sp. 2205SS5-2 TaxID=3109031 RepID=UPI003006DBC8